jgi:hypothetical protein
MNNIKHIGTIFSYITKRNISSNHPIKISYISDGSNVCTYLKNISESSYFDNNIIYKVTIEKINEDTINEFYFNNDDELNYYNEMSIKHASNG